MRHRSHIDVAFLSYQDFPISLYLNDLLFPLVSCLGTKCFMLWNKEFQGMKLSLRLYNWIDLTV